MKIDFRFISWFIILPAAIASSLTTAELTMINTLGISALSGIACCFGYWVSSFFDDDDKKC